MSEQHATQADLKRFVPTGRAAKEIGVCGETLRNWADEGQIDFIRTHTGRYRFDVGGYLDRVLERRKAA